MHGTQDPARAVFWDFLADGKSHAAVKGSQEVAATKIQVLEKLQYSTGPRKTDDNAYWMTRSALSLAWPAELDYYPICPHNKRVGGWVALPLTQEELWNLLHCQRRQRREVPLDLPACSVKSSRRCHCRCCQSILHFLLHLLLFLLPPPSLCPAIAVYFSWGHPATVPVELLLSLRRQRQRF